MINSAFAILLSLDETVPVMVLNPQQLTIYPDGTYDGLLKTSEFPKLTESTISEWQNQTGTSTGSTFWTKDLSSTNSGWRYQQPSSTNFKSRYQKSSSQANEYQHLILGLSSKLPIEYAPELKELATDELTRFIQALEKFSKNISHEKVYLHFDNTSYYQGDPIWFKCYVVTPEQHQLGGVSKTLYVELLNPGGEIVDKRILKIENGQCHGEFTLNRLPFYSGFYEVRAYTKYMLNFGDDMMFSRLFPVFDKPKTEGAFEERKMRQSKKWGLTGPRGGGLYLMKREGPLTEKKVNLRFFPEGGHLVQGVASRVAFEATDESGVPINVTGVVMDDAKQELCRIEVLHEGRGVFTYTPNAGNRKDVAEVEYEGKKYSFDLPSCLPEGVAMDVDNLSYPDSIGITLRKSRNMPAEMYGVSIISGGKLQSGFSVWLADDEVRFKIDKTQFPSGVSQITLFNEEGEILADRLIFTNDHSFLEIKAKTDRSDYKPYELVNMDFSVADDEANPVQTTFSLSVRDGSNEVDYKHNILTDLLLMSEIKGYVRDPSYYFEANDDMRRTALDVLLMVQGWRRYSWKQMTEVENFEIQNHPEQGIETHGKVVTLAKEKPRPGVDVSLLLHQKGDTIDSSDFLVESFVTDQQGRFSFVLDVSGRWNMTLSVMEKGKRKNHLIFLDRIFSPDPARYRHTDMQINIAENITEEIIDEEMPDDEEAGDAESSSVANQDSIAKLGIDERVHAIPEVEVKAKRSGKERGILFARSTSVSHYDVAAEMDNIIDRGEYLTDNIHDFLRKMDENFVFKKGGAFFTDTIFQNVVFEEVQYKAKTPIFIVDYEGHSHTTDATFSKIDFNTYQRIKLSAIKSIYINENASVICQYLPRDVPCVDLLDIYGCVVFIELYPDEQLSAKPAKGVRKTSLEGYSAVKEFYSPDYSELPPEPDYRRTLYWNPAVITDESGKAKIQFYNNSNCTNFSISAETVTPLGMIGIHKNE
jgi:hypothetical protein